MNRKEYVKAIIDDLLADDERMAELSNQLFGGIIAIQAVYEAIDVHGVDKEILKTHIDRLFEQSPQGQALLSKGDSDEAVNTLKEKICPHCGHSNLDHDNTCHQCGKELPSLNLQGGVKESDKAL